MKKTKQYDMFKLSPHNRNVRPHKVKALVQSIQKINMLEHYPILVTADMVVEDGQHRLAAAKQLGVDIYYSIVDTEDVMILLNTNQDRWTFEDYTKYWVSKKIPDYIRFVQIRNKYPFVPKTSLMRLLAMNPKHKYLPDIGREGFRTGKFRILNEEGALKTVEMVRQIEPFLMTGVLSERMFWITFFRLTKHREFNFERFLEQLKLSGIRIHVFGTPREYYRAFEDVYNWHMRGTPIRFY